MINLNLLSYQRRKQIDLLRGKRLVMFFAVVTLFFFVVMILTVLGSVGLADRISKSGAGGKGGEILDRAKVLNDKIIAMNKIQEGFYFFSDSLYDFSKTVPAGVQIDEVIVSKDGKSLTAKGIAATREDLINFKRDLEAATGRFSEVEIRTNDLSSKELVNFDLKTIVNLSGLQ